MKKFDTNTTQQSTQSTPQSPQSQHTYTLHELITTYGTTKQIEKYHNNQTLSYNDKSRLLSKIKPTHHITHNKETDTYTLSPISKNKNSNEYKLQQLQHNKNIPLNIRKLMITNPIYMYLIPILINKLYVQNQSNKKVQLFSHMKYAEHVSMVNQYFRKIRKTQYDTPRALLSIIGTDSYTFSEFMSNTTNILKDQVEKCLSILNDYILSNRTHTVARPSPHDITKEIHTEATIEDMQLIARLIAETDAKCKIPEIMKKYRDTDNSDKKELSIKQLRFIIPYHKQILSKLLRDNGILYYYESFTIVPIPNGEIDALWSEFQYLDLIELGHSLRTFLLNDLIDDAKNRQINYHNNLKEEKGEQYKYREKNYIHDNILLSQLITSDDENQLICPIVSKDNNRNPYSKTQDFDIFAIQMEINEWIEQLNKTNFR